MGACESLLFPSEATLFGHSVCVSVCVKRERGIEGHRKSRMGTSTIIEEEVKN